MRFWGKGSGGGFRGDGGGSRRTEDRGRKDGGQRTEGGGQKKTQITQITQMA